MPTPLIFDCDGVIVDSEAISMGIDTKILQRYGIPLTEAEVHHRFVGSTFQAMVDNVTKAYGVTFPASIEIEKDAEMVRQYKERLPEIPGLKSSLQILRKRGHRMAIASNGPKERIHLALGILGLEGTFDHIVTFEDVPRPKPFPDMYVLAAKLLGVEASDCIVFEDSITGMTAALAAGAKVVGVTATHPHHEEHAQALREKGASAVIHDMGELAKLIAS